MKKWKDEAGHILIAFAGIWVLLFILEMPALQSAGAGFITKVFGVGN